MSVLTVVGNRPQFIKAAAVSGPLRRSHEELLIHTGQHYDEELSDVFFDELGLPSPDRELGISRGSNSSQTSRMLDALESRRGRSSLPTSVLVYGDTNSTLAGALAGAQAGVPVAHVEAGMRSFDRSMPEELNRVLADHASSLLLCSSDVAVSNLHREGVSGAVELVGDVMVDVALGVQPRARERVRPAARTRRRAGAVRARDRAPGRQRRRPRAARTARRAAPVGAPPGRAAAASAHPWPPADRRACSNGSSAQNG